MSDAKRLWVVVLKSYLRLEGWHYKPGDFLRGHDGQVLVFRQHRKAVFCLFNLVVDRGAMARISRWRAQG
jgi:hypothetical protein